MARSPAGDAAFTTRGSVSTIERIVATSPRVAAAMNCSVVVALTIVDPFWCAAGMWVMEYHSIGITIVMWSPKHVLADAEPLIALVTAPQVLPRSDPNRNRGPATSGEWTLWTYSERLRL